MRAGLAAACALVVAALLWQRPAHAHPGYPKIVKDTLGVDPRVFDPPDGCQLCHTSPGGGTALRPFGQRLVSTYGLDSSVSAENDASLVNALKGLQMGDSRLVQDLKGGTDPNVDVTSDPTPQFGCSAAPVGGGGSDRLAVLANILALAAVAVWGTKRRRAIPKK